MNTVTIEDILQHNLLHAVFQPIIASAELDIVGYEGLIRGPAGSTLESPGALFAAARASGRQLELEKRCLRTMWTRFAKLGLPGKLFINVSAAMLLDPAAQHRALIAELADLPFDSRRIVIEVTEEQSVADFRRLRRIARHLRRRGFSLAIDDLGAGYASLRMWLELQPGCVKVDIVFIRGVDRDPIRQAFLRTICALARACGSRVIAEGIETAAEWACVRALGVDYGQGFYLARPSARPPRSLQCQVA